MSRGGGNKVDIVAELTRVDVNNSAIAAFGNKVQASIERALSKVDLSKLGGSSRQILSEVDQIVGYLRRLPQEMEKAARASVGVLAKYDSASGRYRGPNGRFLAGESVGPGLEQKAVELSKKAVEQERRRQTLQKEVTSQLKNELAEVERLATANIRLNNKSNEAVGLLQRRLTLQRQLNELETKQVELGRLRGIGSVSSNANYDPIRQQNAFLAENKAAEDRSNKQSLNNAKQAARKYIEELEKARKQAILSGDTNQITQTSSDLARTRSIQSRLLDPNNKFSTNRLDSLTKLFRGDRNAIIFDKLNNKILDDAANNLGKINNAINRSTLSAAKFGDQIGLAVRRYGAFLVGTAGFFAVINSFKVATDEALKFEKSQTRLAQILSVNRNQVTPITKAAREASLKTGTKTTETLSGVDILAQAGYQDVAQLTFAAEKLSKIPLAATFDGIDKTTDGLLSIFRQFNLELTDTGDLFDKINRVAADYAVESKDVFEGVKRFGSVFTEGGGSFDDALKFFTLVRDRSRESATSIGNFFKSISFRIFRGGNESLLKELGIKGSTVTERLTSSASAFQKRFGDNLEGNPEAIRLAQQIAGLYQGGKFLTFIQALNSDKGKYETSLRNAPGSFEFDTSKRTDDLSVSFQRLQGAVNNFLAEFTSNAGLRGFVRTLADIASGLSKFSSVIAPLALVLGGGAAVAGVGFAKSAAAGLAGRLGFYTRESAELAAVRDFPGTYRADKNGKPELDPVIAANRQALTERLLSQNFLYRRQQRVGIVGASNASNFEKFLYTNTGSFTLGNLGKRFISSPSAVGLTAAGLGFAASQFFPEDSSVRQNDFIGRRKNVFNNAISSSIGGITTGVITGATLGAVAGGPVGAIVGVITALTALALSAKNAKDGLDNISKDKQLLKLNTEYAGRKTPLDTLIALSKESAIRTNGLQQGNNSFINGTRAFFGSSLSNDINKEEATKNILGIIGTRKNVIKDYILNQTNAGFSASNIKNNLLTSLNTNGVLTTSSDLAPVIKAINGLFKDLKIKDTRETIKNLQDFTSGLKEAIKYLNAALIEGSSNLKDNLERLQQSNEKLLNGLPNDPSKYNPSSFNLTGRNFLKAAVANPSLINGTGFNPKDLLSIQGRSSQIDADVNTIRGIYQGSQKGELGTKIRAFLVENKDNLNVNPKEFFNGFGNFGSSIQSLQANTGKSSRDLLESLLGGDINSLSSTARESVDKDIEAISKGVSIVNETFNKLQENSNALSESLLNTKSRVFDLGQTIQQQNLTRESRRVETLSGIGQLSSEETLRARLGILNKQINQNQPSNFGDISRENNRIQSILDLQKGSVAQNELSKEVQASINQAKRDEISLQQTINQNLAKYNNQIEALSQSISILSEEYNRNRSELATFGKEGLSILNSDNPKAGFNEDLLRRFGQAAVGGGRPTFEDLGRSGNFRGRDRVFGNFSNKEQEELLNTLSSLPEVGGLKGLRKVAEERYIDIGTRRVGSVVSAIRGSNLTEQEQRLIREEQENKLKAIEKASKFEEELRKKQTALVELQQSNAKKDEERIAKSLSDNQAISDSYLKFAESGQEAFASVGKAALALQKYLAENTGKVDVIGKVTISPIDVNLTITNSDVLRNIINQNNKKIGEAISAAIEAATGTRPQEPTIEAPEEGEAGA